MRKRRFIVLSGEEEQRFTAVQPLINTIPEQQLLWFTQKSSHDAAHVLTGTISHTINQVLGREHHVVIFDAFSGFNPDAFAALAGTITAGGVLILLCPALAEWHQFDDPFTQRLTSWPYCSADVSGRFIQHFVTHLQQADFIEKIDFSAVSSIPILPQPSYKQVLSAPNNEQQRIIEAIKQVALSKLSELSTALILEADRGRGKSAALGMAAAQLMQLAVLRDNIQHKRRILVIAPTLKTVDVVFHHAQQQLQRLQQKTVVTEQGKGKLCTATASLRFIAPDVAMQTLPKADLVFIDEAAAIPTTLLRTYLKHYPRLVFATTVQGYEGTGRGFSLRFRDYLDQYCQHWQTRRLQQAIRYPAYDELECFIFRLLLAVNPTQHRYLQCELLSVDFRLDDCVIQRVQRDSLLTNIVLLEDLFALLMLAHYQTRPSDLRHLLDGKNVAIYVVFWQKQVIATCLTVQEGGFDAELAEAIYYGKRRPQGHLVAQSLAFHAGLADAPLLMTQRVMRIVVHPDFQRRGIASHLLTMLEQQLVEQRKTDYFSTSFAATEAMLSFWHKQGFNTVHMGLKRDASSGCHSLLMIKPLSPQAEELLKVAQQQFYRHLPVLLENALSDVEQVLIDYLLSIIDSKQIQRWQQKNQPLSALDWADVHTFAYGHRGYDFCLYALRKFVFLAKESSLLATLTSQQQQLLQQLVIDNKPIEQVAKRLKLNGKKMMDKQLRLAIKNL